MTKAQKKILYLHLFFTFAFLFWLFWQPFLNHQLFKKSNEILFQGVVDNQAAFEMLPKQLQTHILQGVSKQTDKIHYFSDLKETLQDRSLWILGWLIGSLLISFLLLYRVHFPLQVIWVLPLLMLGYAASVYLSSPAPKSDSLFPSPEQIITKYLGKTPSNQPNERNKELKKAWAYYLVIEWAHEKPHQDEAILNQQMERGLYAFNVKRVERILEGKGKEDLFFGMASTPSISLMLAFFAWNLLFAWMFRTQNVDLKNNS